MRISEVNDCVKILINVGIIPELDYWSPYNYSYKRIRSELDNITKRYKQEHVNAFIGVYMLKNIDITSFDHQTRQKIRSIWTKIHNVKWESWKYICITSINTRLRDFVKILYDSETQLVKFMYDCGWLNDSIYDVYKKAIISYMYSDSDSEKETLIRIIQIMLQLMHGDILDEDIVVDMDYAKQIATKESYPWNLLHDIGIDIQDCFDIKTDIREKLTKLITDELDLRPKEVESIKLRYIDMLTFSEIGDVIGVSGGRVMQILAKCRRKLYHPVRLGAIRRLIYTHSTDICKQVFVELEGNLPIPASMVHFSLDVLRYIQQYKGIDTYDSLVSTMKSNPVYMRCFRTGNFIDELDRLSKIVNSTEVLRSNDPEVLDIPLEEINLSVRSFNALRRARVNTVGDLVSMTEEDFMKVRNFGKKSYDEIVGILENMGLKLRDSE